MRELLLPIATGVGRRAGLEQALRDGIRAGRIPSGTRLPSTRALAAEHGLARATVVAAYEQLAVEGYLVARQGDGTRVADIRPVQSPAKTGRRPGRRSAPAADFRPGEPDPGLFPRSMWARAVRRVLTDVGDDAFGYGDPRGVAQLRGALAEYLGRSRAVVADPGSVSIFAGMTSSLGFLGEAFRASGIERVATEDPSLFVLRDVLALAGVVAVPVPVDGEGVDVERLAALDVGAVLVTPGHQFPLGITMSAGRRAELVAWAERTGAWIVEDDYDGEFRYDRRPIGALQGLDPDRVIYAGTASKSLSPALRLSWLVVPAGLRGALGRVKHQRAGVSAIEQLALADLIGRGELDRHLRSARAVYLKRQHALAEMLQDRVPWLDTSPSRAGLHLTATIVDDAIRESELVARAADHDIALMGLGPLWMEEPNVEGLVLGYSRPPEHRFADALERLGCFLGSAVTD